jgi:hypothetical protein
MEINIRYKTLLLVYIIYTEWNILSILQKSEIWPDSIPGEGSKVFLFSETSNSRHVRWCIFHICEISGSYRDEYENDSLLGYSTV